MTVLKAMCDKCGKIIESTKENEIHLDYNGEFLCVDCKKNNKKEEIEREIEYLKTDLSFRKREIEKLEQKINKL